VAVAGKGKENRENRKSRMSTEECHKKQGQQTGSLGDKPASSGREPKIVRRVLRRRYVDMVERDVLNSSLTTRFMPHRSPHKAGPSLRRVSRTPHEHSVELNGIPPVKASPTKPLVAGKGAASALQKKKHLQFAPLGSPIASPGGAKEFSC
jgi:hypothetical protein